MQMLDNVKLSFTTSQNFFCVPVDQYRNYQPVKIKGKSLEYIIFSVHNHIFYENYVKNEKKLENIKLPTTKYPMKYIIMHLVCKFWHLKLNILFNISHPLSFDL